MLLNVKDPDILCFFIKDAEAGFLPLLLIRSYIKVPAFFPIVGKSMAAGIKI